MKATEKKSITGKLTMFLILAVIGGGMGYYIPWRIWNREAESWHHSSLLFSGQ